MKGLLCCAEILGVLLFIQWSVCQGTNAPSTEMSAPTAASNVSAGNTPNNQLTTAASTVSVSKTTSSPSACQCVQTNPATTAAPRTVMYLIKHHPNIIITCGALIIACTILLISTLTLAWKVCQLSRRLRTLGSNGSLVGSSQYWTGMDKRNKVESQPEAKENSFLLTENSQTNQEIDSNTAKEDGRKAGEDGQNGEEKKVGDGPETKEASPTAPAESSPSSKPEEETPSSETTTFPPPPSSSEDTEEPKEEP